MCFVVLDRFRNHFKQEILEQGISRLNNFPISLDSPQFIYLIEEIIVEFVSLDSNQPDYVPEDEFRILMNTYSNQIKMMILNHENQFKL